MNQMIEQRLRKQLINTGLRMHKVEKIILFGSRAVGDNTGKSDIDLAIVAPNMTAKEWDTLTYSIEDELDTLLLLDIVKFDNATLQLKNEIIKNGKVLYCVEVDENVNKN